MKAAQYVVGCKGKAEEENAQDRRCETPKGGKSTPNPTQENCSQRRDEHGIDHTLDPGIPLPAHDFQCKIKRLCRGNAVFAIGGEQVPPQLPVLKPWGKNLFRLPAPLVPPRKVRSIALDDPQPGSEHDQDYPDRNQNAGSASQWRTGSWGHARNDQPVR